MPAIFVENVGWVQVESQIPESHVCFVEQNFTIHIPDSFIIKVSKETQGFAAPYSNPIEVGIRTNLLNHKNLEDPNKYKWRWRFERAGTLLTYQSASMNTYQPTEIKLVSGEGNNWKAYVDAPNFLLDSECVAILEAKANDNSKEVESNPAVYNRDGIEVNAETEWHVFEQNGKKLVQVSVLVSNPCDAEHEIILKWERVEKKIQVPANSIKHSEILLIEPPLPREFQVSHEQRLELLSDQKGVRGFKSEVVKKIEQPSLKLEITNISSISDDGDSKLIISFDKDVELLTLSKKLPICLIPVKTPHYEKQRVHELECVEIQKQDIIFSIPNGINRGTHKMYLQLELPDGKEFEWEENIQLQYGDISCLTDSVETLQVNDHLEIKINISINSSFEEEMLLTFTPHFEMPKSILSAKRFHSNAKIQSHFSGESLKVIRGTHSHTIYMALPLYSKFSVNWIQADIRTINIKSDLDGIQIDPLKFSILEDEKIACFSLYKPDWRDSENFKPKNRSYDWNDTSQVRIEKFEHRFKPALNKSLKKDEPASSIEEVEILQVYGHGTGSLNFLLPTQLDLQPHSHFWNAENSPKFMEMNKKIESLDNDWYYLRIKSCPEKEIFDPLEMFEKTVFKINGTHLFLAQYFPQKAYKDSMVRDAPEIEYYGKHRTKIIRIGKNHQVETPFLIPDDYLENHDSTLAQKANDMKLKKSPSREELIKELEEILSNEGRLINGDK